MARKSSTPDVYEKEIDLSEITTPAGTSTGAIVITSPKGPVNRPVLVTSDKDFIEQFGKPVLSGSDAIYGYGSYAAIQFLNESSALYVIRASDSTEEYFSKAGVSTDCSSYELPNIGASAGPLPDKVDEIYAIDNATISGANLLVAAVSPGDWGNDIAVTVESLTSASDWFYSYDDLPYGVPTSAIPSSSMSIANSVFRLNVFVKESTQTWESFTQTRNGTSALVISPVETFYGTVTSQLDGNNNQLFIKDVVNGNSKYIYVDVNGNPTNFTQSSNPNAITSANEYIGYKNENLIRLTGGNQVAKTGIGQYYPVWEYFRDTEQYDISIVILPDYSSTVKQMVAQNVVGYRKDCILVTQSGTVSDITVQQIWDAEQYGYSEPSYVCLYAGWDKYYDKYNSKSIFLPKSIFAAEIIARTDNVANVWNSPSGLNRGILSSSDQNKVWLPEEIGQLYDKNINTSRLFNGAGFVIWGQKTAQMKASALDRINVRRLLIFLRKTIKRFLQPYVLDVNNTPKTRLRIWSNIDSFLSTIKSQEGLIAYEVVCDDTNNTDQVIDANQLNVDVYVQPPKTVEYISLNHIITRTGVNFSEVRVR
jgi:hypothetical protein